MNPWKECKGRSRNVSTYMEIWYIWQNGTALPHHDDAQKVGSNTNSEPSPKICGYQQQHHS